MKDLPSVEDDHRNIRQTVKMLHIPDENIFEIQDASHDQMSKITQRLTEIVLARGRVPKMETGIYGERDQLKGIRWDRIKIRAMLEGASEDFIIVRPS